MISLTKKCATMSTLNIQDTKKRMDQNQPEKKKGAISRGVKVWTCIFKHEVKQRLRRNQLTIQAISQISAMTIHWLDITFEHSQYRIYAQYVYDLFTLLFTSTI